MVVIVRHEVVSKTYLPRIWLWKCTLRDVKLLPAGKTTSQLMAWVQIAVSGETPAGRGVPPLVVQSSVRELGLACRLVAEALALVLTGSHVPWRQFLPRL